MEILYLLIPLSAGLVLLIIAIFGWALHRGQFEDLDNEGERILTDEAAPLDGDQGLQLPPPKQSTHRRGPPEQGDI